MQHVVINEAAVKEHLEQPEALEEPPARIARPLVSGVVLIVNGRRHEALAEIIQLHDVEDRASPLAIQYGSDVTDESVLFLD